MDAILHIVISIVAFALAGKARLLVKIKSRADGR